MKKIIFATVAAIGAIGVAAAIAEHHEGGDNGWEAEVEATFNSIDADADGTITSEEYMAHKMAQAEEEWGKWANDDGVVTLESAKATYQAMAAEKEAAMAKDKDSE